MKKFLPAIILAILILPTTVSGQGSWLSASNVVGNGDVIVTDMAIDDNGDSYITGWFDTNIISSAGSIASNGSFDVFLLKINSDGTDAWLKGFGGNFPDLPGGVEIGPDGTVYISGAVNGTVFFDATTSITTTNADAFLANYNPDGTLNWVKIAAGGPKNQRAEAMALDTINDVIIIGGLAVDSVIYDVQRVGYAGKFTHLSTYDLAGNHLLSNTIGFKVTGLPRSITCTGDGYVVVGDFRDSLFFDIDSIYNASTGFDTDIYLYKADLGLNGQWIRRTTSMFGENVAYSVKFDGVDDIYAVGKTGALDMEIDSTDTEKVRNFRTSGSDEYFIFNYINSTGELDWYTIGGSNRTDGLWDLLVMPDRLVATGYHSGDLYFGNDTLFNQTSPPGKEILVAEFDLNGEIFHARNAVSEPAHFDDQGYRIGLNPDDVIVVAGVYRSEVINFEATQFSNISPEDPDIFLATYGCIGGGTVGATSTDLTCYGDYSGEITVTATGGFTSPAYGPDFDAFFDNGDTVINRKFDSPGVLGGFPAGVYDITVYNNANCLVGISNATITQPDSLQYTYTVVHPDCNAAVTGSIVLADVLGGTSPYQYSINGGTDFQAELSFNDLPAGDYSIIVEDANGCQTEALDTTLVAPAVLDFEFEVVNDSLTCFGETISEIHFKNVSGGSGGYMYSINGGANYQADTFFVALTGGDYSLIVSDMNACATAVIDTTIYMPEEIVFTYTVTQPECFGEMGSIEFDTPNGGTGAYMYSIMDTPAYSGEMAYSDLGSSTYSLIVQDASLCESAPIDTSIMEAPDALMVDSIQVKEITSDSDGYFNVFGSGGSGDLTITLHGPDTTVIGDGNFALGSTFESGDYWIVVYDNICDVEVSTDTVTIANTVGINSHDLQSALIYPNPTAGEITVRMLYQEAECTIEVLSLAGQVVDTRKAFTSGGELNEIMDLGHLAKGMYMIRIDGRMLKSGVVLQ